MNKNIVGKNSLGKLKINNLELDRTLTELFEICSNEKEINLLEKEFKLIITEVAKAKKLNFKEKSKFDFDSEKEIINKF